VIEAVSKAIFTREAEMITAISKIYPELAKVPAGELEFGYRSQEFDADPIELAKREFADDKKNFFQKVRARARIDRMHAVVPARPVRPSRAYAQLAMPCSHCRLRAPLCIHPVCRRSE
jgi:hypothetical protein